ncbi:MAG: ATP-binding protein [Patescibacteria group bacterium]
MNKIKDFLKYINKIGFKVALLIILLVASLLIFVNIFAMSRGERIFTDVYGLFTGPNIFPPERMPYSDDPFFIFPGPQKGELLTPGEHFRTRFENSLIIIGLAAFLGAIGIGYLTSRTVTKPLNKLSGGLKKLRQSHYQLRLDENESAEFNAIIQEFNSLAAELQRVEELRKNLISDTSHELRTPLASLTAQLEGLQDGVLKLDNERIKSLKEQVDRLTEMTEGLQDYAVLRSQSVKIQRQDIILKDIIDKLMGFYKEKLAKNKMAFAAELPENYTLNADAVLLSQVFTNLFDNALRYSKAQNITLFADEKQIIFADDGVGIPPEHLQDIFERFFRLEKSRNRLTGGLGLGLAIAKEIVEAHGWKISARIPENKKGTEFVIDL